MKKVLIPFGALILGAVIGFVWAAQTRPETPSAPTDEEVRRPQPLADQGESASNRALRQRIAALERALAAAQAASGAPTNGAPQAAGAGGRPPFGHEAFRAHLEELKKSDPARYSEVTNRIAQGRLRRAARQQAKLDFLASIDTSHMSAKAKNTHDALQEALARREEIEQRLQDESLTEDQRRSVFDEMRSIDRQIATLNRQERGNLIAETAKSLGFTGDDVTEISTTVSEIIEATSGNRGGTPPGPPPSGGQPPAGGAGGPGPM